MRSCLFSGPQNNLKTVEYGCSTEYWLQHGSEKLSNQPSKNNATELPKSFCGVGAYADLRFALQAMVQQKQKATSNRGGQCLLPKQTIIYGPWIMMESLNPATSTWALQVAVGHPCSSRPPQASLMSTLAACLTTWTRLWLIGPSLPALDLQPPRAARPQHWLLEAPGRLRAFQRSRLRRCRLRRLLGGHLGRSRPLRRSPAPAGPPSSSSLPPPARWLPGAPRRAMQLCPSPPPPQALASSG